jgi:hypothetical protein
MAEKGKISILKIILVASALFISFLVAALVVVNVKQDEVVAQVVSSLNEGFSGKLEIEGSHISPFANFPYLSIDLENLTIYEGKEDTSQVLLQVTDTYVGFNLISILTSNFEVKKIKLENGFLKLVQHTDGTFNVLNAISTAEEESADEESSSPLDLNVIQLINIDILKINEANDILVETFIEKAEASFKSSDSIIAVELESQFLFNLLIGEDTTFLREKHLTLQTALEYDIQKATVRFQPSTLDVENARFNMQGSIDISDHMNLDLHFKGNKENFDLFFAFAPPDIQTVLKRYDNGGQIYFIADVVGKSIDGYSPAIEIDFGCEDAFVVNSEVGKSINDLYFKGHFTNGSERNATTMELTIEDFSASPETGKFNGKVSIKNFTSPEFDIQLLSEFDLEFLAKFVGIKNLEDISGKVFLEMNFHDIIDLSQPEKSIERLNESYFTKLVISDLNVNSSVYPLPIKNLNVKAEMDGHAAIIDQFSAQVGNSDISLTASISDLPAILHHTDKTVEAILNISADSIHLDELTKIPNDSSSGVNELITDLSLRLKLISSAKAITESPTLPIGEFFIEELHAQLNNYPHELHDFNADILIDSNNFNVIDFTGMLDDSDFHFNGNLENYGLWFDEVPKGKTSIDFDLTSKLLQLDDLFSYGGENYVPEDYRNEEFSDLELHAVAHLYFDEKLISSSLHLDKLETGLKVHPMKFREVSAELYMDSSLLEVKDFKGKLGNSDLQLDARFYLSADSTTNSHQFALKSKRLDFDQIFAYERPPENKVMTPEDHEDVFNIFQLPFSNLDFKFDLAELNYHRYLIQDFSATGRMNQDHYIYLDSLGLRAAGGELSLKGYFNGSDPKKIYLHPQIQVKNIDLDQLLFKFENFGQDHLVSDNLHGKMSGTVSGKVHVHADLTPIIDDSELSIDVRVVNGSLTNYSAMEALSDYFSDKNLSNIRFDTLNNKLNLKNGKIEIPQMDINSTIGYFEIAGEQSLNLDMEYYVRIPLKLVTSVGFNKLFNRKADRDMTEPDSIQSKEDFKNSPFLNLKVQGNPDNYKISVGKKK